MQDEKTEDYGEKPPRIRRGRVDSLDLYEITDYELDILEKGSPSSIYLNFSIFLFSTAVTSLTALVASSFQNPFWEIVFILLTMVGFILGSVFALIWWRSRGEVSEIVKRIKKRLPDAAQAEPPNIPGQHEEEQEAPSTSETAKG